MTALNDTAKAMLRDAGISQAAWIRAWSGDGEWHGDVCGCPDDRCANGFHHIGEDDCQCLPVWLEGVVEVRMAGSGFAAAVLAAILRAHKSVEVLSGPHELGGGRQSLMVQVRSPAQVLAALRAARELQAPAEGSE